MPFFSTLTPLVPMMLRKVVSLCLIAAATTTLADDAGATATAEAKTSAEGFVSIFNGENLDGWKVSKENPDSWSVELGKLKCDGPRAHLFYVGPLAPMDDFHFRCEVKTTPGSNSGIYFHTKYQPEGWPKYGYECQVNVSHKDPKKTSSLYAVENVDDPGVEDDEWYTQEIIVRDRHIELKVNGKTMVDYTEPEDKESFSDDFERRLGEGTIGLQAHDPDSVVYFRNLEVKPLD